MSPTSLEWVGTVGFWLIEASYLFQIVKLHKMKESDEFNMLFPGLNMIGRVLALIYSISQGKSVFVFGFALGITLRLVLLTQVLWYRNRSRSRARMQDEAVSI